MMTDEALQKRVQLIRDGYCVIENGIWWALTGACHIGPSQRMRPVTRGTGVLPTPHSDFDG